MISVPDPIFAAADRIEERPFSRQIDDEGLNAIYDHEPVVTHVSAKEIDEFIETLAESGCYEDELGSEVKAAPIYHALAQDWVDDRWKLPGNTFIAFLDWAVARTRIAKRGKS